MKYSVLIALGAAAAFAQSVSTTYTTDLNGQRVADSSVKSAASPTTNARTLLSQSLNGREVPLEQTEDRVIRNDATGKVTERIVRKYDPTGQLSSTERVVTEEHPKAGGGSVVRATIYRSDVNGREQEAERRVAETRVAGASSITETSIERPTLNGAFEATEKRNMVTSGKDTDQTTTETVYRPSPGGFAEAVRRVIVTTRAGDSITQHESQYEAGVTVGSLQLKSQTVSSTTKDASGREITQVDLYAPSAYGTVQPEGSPQQIKEREVITRTKAADGSVIETLSIRRPSLADPKRLGDPEKISETVCRGKCDSPKP